MPTTPRPAPPFFHLIAKPTGAVCNLGCKYCFFLSKKVLYPGSRFRMDNELLKTYIKQLLESQSRMPEVNVAWQGGEPTLMGLEFFKLAVDMAERYKQPGQTILHTIQTNGTRIDDAWASFFKKHNFLVGVSVDGPRDLHDTYRVDKSGAGSFDRVIAGLKYLRMHGVDFNILCTVNAANQDYPLEVYRFFRDEQKVQYIQFIPIVERVTAGYAPPPPLPARSRWPGCGHPLYAQAGSPVMTGRSVGAEQYGRFLITIFEEWVRRDVGKVFVQMFDVTLGSFIGQYSLCVFSPTCGNALALEHNGDIYPCDHYVESGYKLGTIKETHLIELVGSDKQRRFGRDKLDRLPGYCRTCTVRFACNGGCPVNRFLRTPDGDWGLNYLCTGYRLFFNHVIQPMNMMASLLRQGRPADEVMSILYQ
ncbi:MAG: anaerobic sulfatase maturase [bacterium]